MDIDALILHNGDNVATAVQSLSAGTVARVRCGAQIRTIPLDSDIPYGHKFAVQTIANGENILKYGEVIGAATADIACGEHVHVQNVVSLRGRGDLQEKEA